MQIHVSIWFIPGKMFISCIFYLTNSAFPAFTSHFHEKGAFCASFESKDHTKQTDHEPPSHLAFAVILFKMEGKNIYGKIISAVTWNLRLYLKAKSPTNEKN